MRFEKGVLCLILFFLFITLSMAAQQTSKASFDVHNSRPLIKSFALVVNDRVVQDVSGPAVIEFQVQVEDKNGISDLLKKGYVSLLVEKYKRGNYYGFNSFGSKPRLMLLDKAGKNTANFSYIFAMDEHDEVLEGDNYYVAKVVAFDGLSNSSAALSYHYVLDNSSEHKNTAAGITGNIVATSNSRSSRPGFNLITKIINFLRGLFG